MPEHNTLSYRSIFHSYLSLCLLMLLFTGIGFIYSIHYIRSELAYSTSLESKNTVSEINNHISQTFKICDALSTSTDLLSLTQADDTFDAKDIKHAISLQTVMKEINIQGNLYQNLFVYFPKSDALISQNSKNRQGKADITSFCRSYGIDRERFLSIMSEDYTKLYYILDQNNTVWFLRPVLSDDANEKQAVIIAEFSGTSLINSPHTAEYIFLRTEEGEFIHCIGRLGLEEAEEFPTETEIPQAISIHNQRYISISLASQYFNWRCYIANPFAIFIKKLYPILAILAGEIVSMILMGLILSLRLSQRTYIPMEHLMKDNQKLSEEIDQKNLFLDYIELISFFQGTSKQYSASTKKLLSDRLGDDKEEYILALVQKRDSASAAPNQAGSYTADALPVLNQALEKFLFNKYKGIFVPVEQSYLVIVKPKEQEDSIENLRKTFMGFALAVSNQTDQRFHIILSRKEKGYHRFPAIYHYLLDGLQYVSFWNLDDQEVMDVHYYGELLAMEESEEISGYGPGILRLLTCLENENFRQAYDELNQLYKEAFPHDQRHLKHNLYRMYGLIELLITTLDIHADEEEKKFYQSLHYKEKLYRIQSLSELVKESHDIFEAIIEYKETKVTDTEPDWIKNILSFIDEHYRDPSLSVSVIANQFHISVPHLSRSFKAEKNIGPLEYIHRTRVDAAKELLQGDLAIKDIASMVGYQDTQALTRAFKRIEGLTPSHFREKIKK